MRKLILKMSISVDGFVGRQNGQIDWIFRSLESEATNWIAETLWQAGLHIMGSRTYQDMATYWPSSTDELAAPMNQIPKMVFVRSHRLKRPGVEPMTKALEDAIRAKPLDPSRPNESWHEPLIATGDLARQRAG